MIQKSLFLVPQIKWACLLNDVTLHPKSSRSLDWAQGLHHFTVNEQAAKFVQKTLQFLIQAAKIWFWIFFYPLSLKPNSHLENVETFSSGVEIEPYIAARLPGTVTFADQQQHYNTFGMH